MLTYSFEQLENDSLYTYLYKCIRKDILSGALKAGERLPSKRTFAKHLNISTITIENAYTLLQTEGYIYSMPKKGYFVTDIRSDAFNGCMPDDTRQYAGQYADISHEIEDAVRPSTTAAFFADFSSNQTMRENFPFSIWTRLVREVMAEEGEHLLKNAPAGGIYALREAIANHLRDFRDMHVSPSQIIVGAGTEYLYSLLIQLLGFDSIYAVENPGYPKLDNVYKSHGVDCRYIELDKSGMRVDILEKTPVNVIHISPSHHFPTGITMPISRRYELLGWASKEENRYIIEDDYDSEFRLSGKPIPTLQSIDMSERVIYMNTFTKSLASTIRISYMVLPATLLKSFYERLGFYSCTVSNFDQYTLSAFIRKGFYEKHINRMRNEYKKKRNLLLAAIEKSPLSSLATISEEDAGLHFLMHVRSSLADDVIIENAKKQGIGITSLANYYHETKQTGSILPKNRSVHTFVINYSNIEVSRIEEAVNRLYLSIQDEKHLPL